MIAFEWLAYGAVVVGLVVLYGLPLIGRTRP